MKSKGSKISRNEEVTTKHSRQRSVAARLWPHLHTNSKSNSSSFLSSNVFCHVDEERRPSSITRSDSGVASLPDETALSQRCQRRPPGSLNIAAHFAKSSADRPTSGFGLKMVKEIKIADGSTGFGYETLFGDGLDARLRAVFVDDPYIRLKSQAANFVVFCEMLVARAPNVKKIVLRTQDDPTVDHRAMFANLKWALFERNIQLIIERSETIHDREIRFDNGWVFRIGRGLDYFQKQQCLSIGISDYNLRRCLETVVCITKDI